MVSPSPDPSPAPPISTSPRFQGRVAIITGAARAMGRSHAVALAREGCDLVLCDILEDLPDGTPYPKATAANLDETARRVEAHGRRCIALKADVGEPSQAASLVDRATRELGRLDYLITNAAVTIEGPITETRPETFDLVLRTNLQGVFNVLSPSLQVMTGQGRGRVVVIGSGSGRHAEANAAPYVASKWGLIGLAKTAALEVAKSGVTVNVILPGPVDTPMMDNPIRYRQAVPDKPEPTRDDYLQAKKDATPMGIAWVKPEDITAAVLFLLSDEARFISGETLSIDAGDSAHWT
ncbi:NAD(P)-dependent dehydrogenase (short-subunit alcohol dehydrogenase family) [Inquilinus ginsengisoli]|uniref:SDR family oxidoreductase n=1 Tax=Inquilinus ginsengisoli TaxID=363840 RepID=UPI003D22EBA1